MTGELGQTSKYMSGDIPKVLENLGMSILESAPDENTKIGGLADNERHQYDSCKWDSQHTSN
eukprot:CAMPEP_0184680408 /NCGR_PEP_ID=MMETSP0312-20130426/3280_1 /TAXON_ID=31354 /ORGANISM="Compsopogon coeruleus, Strain SAG 36.94" /LENGTH=61 /DNA_ID=CAMNT_0027130481 /DNA_START=41 /DNA_END=223 /DNA_ORIENTATION=+